MGKITGFLEYQRLHEATEDKASRTQHYREFIQHLTADEAKIQGARCMDCGTPFCVSGCPVNNIIPDFNDLVYRQDWRNAIETLHSTNNFPEFTGRVCPAPCEEACTLRINNDPVGIKSIEHAIIDKAWEEGWVRPQPPAARTGRRIAIVGSGPAGLACAQQLARAGHGVVVFEKNDRIGGLLRYGIPDFKLEKRLIDRRLEQLRAEGVEFKVNHAVGPAPVGAGNGAAKVLDAATITDEFDAVVLAVGAKRPRDLPVPGRELDGVYFAMDFLALQNRRVAGDTGVTALWAKGKHVVIIGGGDTGSDCVGPSNRPGAASVVQFELLPMPPEADQNPVWPYWPQRLRTSSSHEEGCQRDWSVATKRFVGQDGKVEKLVAARIEWKDGRMQEIPGSEFEMQADLVLLAMGFVSPVQQMLDAFGVAKDARGNAQATTDGGCYATSIPVYTPATCAASVARGGQSAGRQVRARSTNSSTGSSTLPR